MIFTHTIHDKNVQRTFYTDYRLLVVFVMKFCV